MEVKFVELKQKHVEAFEADLPEAKTCKGSQYNGLVVKAAVKAGWLIEPKVDDVGEMAPGTVMFLAQEIVQEYARVIALPPS